MSLSVIAYNNLQVSPYELVHLQEFKMTKKINDHVRVYLTGIIPETLKDSYVEMTEAQTKIKINQIDEKAGSTPLFSGVALNIEIKAVRDIYYIEIEAVSHSYNLDIKRKSRSFQNKDMPYSSLLKKVVSDYPGADVIDFASHGATLKKFTMQYQETDWQFLKRMASRFHTGLVPAPVFDQVKFYFGVPEGAAKGKLEDFHYSVRKKIADFRISSENYIPGINENDFIYYEVETDKVLNIGDSVSFRGKTLVVSEAYTQMKNGLLKHRYILCSKKGMSQNTIYQQDIAGMSIQGKVIQVEKDNVKLHLKIDKEQSVAEAYWFHYSPTYTAEGNSGWYCMPEVNDYVQLYFPSHKEEEGIAVSAVRKDTEITEKNKIGNPDIKYFRTAAGKEVMLSPEEIVISAKDNKVFIKLNEKGGIEIYSTKNIKIISQEDITINSENKVILSAKDEISMTCKESNIKLDGNTSIIGKELKTN
ncbi:contractile injection system protein, VgrG/Pvc8 family [Aneurinibacillus thermoaerophilus]|uniref:contractile injection system protein, VgrG/Pvc8 family n=1 Tax=Aneurinibacillus thermoaerophilus TaxID=143495 RepID=UPI002E1F0CFC|nr:contractile injection system protein, VgrG/Pvc8 family [Aneurinibacillus thermoaerophilus]MED0766275.1 contractile injection system protein, VgrG/Pvc8 family [Aneurinibacillus thermoaerophilus]